MIGLDHLFEPLDDLLLGLTERDLIGNLKKISDRLGAFAMQPANGQPDLVHGVDDLVHLITHDQPGQVEHCGGAHSGADVRRTGGQVAELRMKGKFEQGLELAVRLVDHGEDFSELETASRSPASADDPPR